jgi:hypothetical protein
MDGDRDASHVAAIGRSPGGVAIAAAAARPGDHFNWKNFSRARRYGVSVLSAR